MRGSRSNALKSLRAKGRLKPGQMNRTEQAYASFLEAKKHDGVIAAYWFESIKLKVADGACWYLPDFLVCYPDGALELHEVKGSPRIFADDAKVKCKVVSGKFPFPLFVVYPRPKRIGGGWDIEEYPNAGR